MTRIHWSCPIGTCAWTHDAPSPFETMSIPGAYEESLRPVNEHFTSHTPQEYLTTIHDLKRELARYHEAIRLLGWSKT